MSETPTNQPPPGASRSEIAETGLAYDTLAQRYDRLMWENPVLGYSARVSERLVTAALADKSTILEVGCGTGRETLKLAALGKKVVACDVSKSSLAVLRERAEAQKLGHLIETRHLPASQVGTLEAEFGAHAFDGGSSSFALHYEPDLGPIPMQLWRLLKPRAPFVCSIFNRLCLMELLLGAPFLVPRRGLRRLEGEMRLPVDQFEASVWSRTPSEVRSLFARCFSLEGTWGLPAVIPPHYLHALVTMTGGFRPVWEEFDSRVNGRWPFRNLGSHTAYLFRSKNAVG